MEFFAVFMALLIYQQCISIDGMNLSIGFALSKCTSLMNLLQWTIRVLSEVQTLMTCVERVEEYTKLPLEETPAQTERALAVPKDWPSKGHVVFSSVSLQYPNCPKNVLNKISLEFAPAQKIAVVGRTGAGKSSLVSAIFRILEPSPAGSLQIDNVNISAISLGVLRSRIAIIPQDPFLFKGTIRFNLDPFQQHTDDQLWDALRRAEVQEIVQEIPQRLEAEVQEGGANFSVGERQLFCLARAILRQPRVIVMDEATANIDVCTTEKIIRAMENSFNQATVITIVHRLHTIMEYDRVLVLEKGEVGEFDSPFRLLSREDSLFAGMVTELGDDAVSQMKEVARLSDVRKEGEAVSK
jgi:ATP-binding cassette subfamily C (CFTR/MRP) protein 4